MVMDGGGKGGKGKKKQQSAETGGQFADLSRVTPPCSSDKSAPLGSINHTLPSPRLSLSNGPHKANASPKQTLF